MNVGIAVHNYDASEGTGGYVVRLLPRIAAEHRVTLYTGRVAAPVPAGVEVVRVPALMGRTYARILTFPAAFRAVRRHHDLVHVQGWVSGAADIATAHIVLAAWRDAARAAGIPPPPGERLFGRFVQWREAQLLGRSARQVIAPSGKVRGEIATWYGRQANVTVIPHGFPAPTRGGDRAASRRDLGLPPSARIALFVGDLRKGLGAAVSAVSHVADLRLAVVSHVPKNHGIARAAHAGLGQRLDWLGPLDDVSVAYAAADLLLHPTIYDAFGLVVAEAMAQGLPVVVTRAAGISELITHGQSGWIVDGEAVPGLVTALEALRDPALARRLGAAASARAAQRSWDVVAGETLAVYRRASAP
jgi:glycosyltransferase involved in cell wall biosynthesis